MWKHLRDVLVGFYFKQKPHSQLTAKLSWVPALQLLSFPLNKLENLTGGYCLSSTQSLPSVGDKKPCYDKTSPELGQSPAICSTNRRDSTKRTALVSGQPVTLLTRRSQDPDIESYCVQPNHSC
ncbi:hypothetical protein RRG08_014679 [Elysia crispata]|uniref:Uncharacterized protein n=1 Tax=Elysia crispata TaxID=231223 RepID=A0AAE0YJI6_9GAST|nr:hypothetical protein RRG08_014679 [Elysia crispata]